MITQKMKRCRTSILIQLFAIASAVFGCTALNAQTPSPSPVPGPDVMLGNYRVTSTTELGWRWRDSLIYVTHGVPKEPTFSTAAIVANVSPARLAAIHSTSDEFVPLSVVQRVFDAAHDPKRLWIVRASDHRFSDNLAEFDRRLLEAATWAAGEDGR